jgi:hypothetical protein
VTVDGFYSAYFTGAKGNSLGLFVFENGRIIGVDVGGIEYDGTYAVDANRGLVTGKIVFIVKPGHALITGAQANADPLRYEFALSIPAGFADGRVVQIDTPTGPVNARFEKVRDWK